MGRPVPVWARLAVSEAQGEYLKTLATQKEVKKSLQLIASSLISKLEPQLQAMKAEGLVIDYAASYLLAELVVHVPEEKRVEVVERLRAMPELSEVSSNIKATRARLRKK